MTALVDKTWAEYGSRIDALNDVVFVRTDPPETQSDGGILFTQKESWFYNGLPKGIFKWGTVVAAGKRTEVVIGDRICFPRIDFAWVHRFDDNTYLGYAREEMILLRDQGAADEKA